MRSLTYYDKVLIAIAVSLIIGTLSGVLFDIRLVVGVFAGSLMATVFVWHALFYRSPYDTTSVARHGAILWHVMLGLLLLLTLW